MDEQARGRLRSARSNAGIGVRELSRRVGISASMLSHIESGRSEPSVATLYALVSALGISLDEVLGVKGSGAILNPASFVVKPADRATIVLDTGVKWERLTPTPDPDVDALLVTYPPGSSSSNNGGLMRHAGKEYGFLLSGQLVVQVGFESMTLNAGDALSFDSSTPHMYRNEGSEPAVGIWHVTGRSRDEAYARSASEAEVDSAVDLPAAPP
ncbi:cupin domain-containing protein [Pimelobacter simplex]|uniref:cupin domain-containing protein n=1 Tax=Nocardioides simplex TaxID=2045 RepID=UPI0019334DFC